MPISSFPANAEGMPKFDKRAIMSAAWERYRDFRKRYASWQIERGIVDASFSNCLKIAWRIAKQEALEREASATALAAYGGRAADRVRELTSEMMRIDARPWAMRSHQATSKRDAVSNELTALRRALSY